MFALILSLTAAAASSQADRAADLCGPVLASKAGGKLSGIEVQASSISNGWTVIRGNLIVLSAMGSTPPGVVRANHVIRTVHSYVCWVRGGRVIKQQLGDYG